MAIFAIVFTFATLENAQRSDFHLYLTWMVLFWVEVAALAIFRKPIAALPVGRGLLSVFLLLLLMGVVGDTLYAIDVLGGTAIDSYKTRQVVICVVLWAVAGVLAWVWKRMGRKSA